MSPTDLIGKEVWVNWAVPTAPSLGYVVAVAFCQEEDRFRFLIQRGDGTFSDYAAQDLKVR